MKKPYGVEEFDGYPMPKVQSNRTPLTKEEEDKISAKLRADVLKAAKITSPKATISSTRKTREIS